ncbi:MAG TPA: helix-turn-helix domain-containing protein [Solirubrobacteraceae bacterium]|jgi:AcrR family transcriptional regulator
MATATRNRRRRLDRRTRTARAEGRDGRAMLLEAAMEVFAQRGYRDASVDDIAERAGYSKGAIYFYFSGKDDLLFALFEERVDRPMREAIKLLESAPPGDDMAAEANRHFVELVSGQRELLLLDHEYRSLAIRDSRLRARYVKREAKLRAVLAKGLQARLKHLGAPPLAAPEQVATALLSLASGLAQEKLIEPDAVPDDLLGDMFALIYAGHVAQAQR